MSDPSDKGANALVLAGAVAKGAFEAGAIAEIAAAGIPIRRIVGASSGALNGTLYAAAVRARRERQDAEKLVQLWEDNGGWQDAFHVSLNALLHFQGVSDQQKLMQLLQAHVLPNDNAASAEVDLTIILTAIEGARGRIGGRDATTFEASVTFDGAVFDRADTLERVFTAAAGSASFPGGFAPLNVPGVGAAWDGGINNNTPIKHALGTPGIDRVFAVVPFPAVESVDVPLGGSQLFLRLTEILINQRLFRDLHDAEQMNETLAKLDALATSGDVSVDAMSRVRAALSDHPLRRVEIVSIRPAAELEGNLFSGFFDAGLRKAYVAEGRRAAREALQAWRSREAAPKDDAGTAISGAPLDEVEEASDESFPASDPPSWAAPSHGEPGAKK